MQDPGTVIETDDTGVVPNAAVDISVGGTGSAQIARIVTDAAGLVPGALGRVTIAALGGSLLDNDDANNPNITAGSIDLRAQDAIGTIPVGTFTQNTPATVTGNPIELAVTSIFKVATSAADSTIHLHQTGSLTISPLAIDIAGVDKGSAIIRATGDVNAGAPNSIDLFGNDNLALIAGGKVTLPTAEFNTAVTGKPAGDLIMSGNDVVAFGNSRTMNFAANHLFFTSQAPGGDPLGSDILNRA